MQKQTTQTDQIMVIFTVFIKNQKHIKQIWEISVKIIFYRTLLMTSKICWKKIFKYGKFFKNENLGYKIFSLLRNYQKIKKI